MLEKIKKEVIDLINTTPKNIVAAEDAISPEVAGTRIWQEPIFGVASAEDELFKALLDPAVVHPDAKLPTDYMPDAKSVISFFLPFTDKIKEENARAGKDPSPFWFNGSDLGQKLLLETSEYICSLLRAEGYEAIIPSLDKSFKRPGPMVTCWSERHTAYICGLGTFGMSRGLITEKGVAGRFGSVITNAPIEPTGRKYSSPFEYCIRCGACQENCPGGVIDVSKGFADAKDNAACTKFLSQFCAPYQSEKAHYHCCGKCQVNVPCANGIPGR